VHDTDVLEPEPARQGGLVRPDTVRTLAHISTRGTRLNRFSNTPSVLQPYHRFIPMSATPRSVPKAVDIELVPPVPSIPFMTNMGSTSASPYPPSDARPPDRQQHQGQP